ncbi:MAG: alpha/beta hydrolase [Cytophagaceae bacterium]|nr:alpha/beta hydrolase [Cytophagaceae bacterium]
MVQTTFHHGENIHLRYHAYGRGPRVLLAFHGMGQSGISFFSLGNELGDTFTTYAFDLFYHGESSGLVEPLSKPLWAEIVRRFLAEKGIDRFSIVGFSLGGRLALATLEGLYERIDELLLIAPDGLAESPIYTAATRLPGTRRLFRKVIYEPEQFSRLVTAARRWGMVPESVVKLAKYQLSSPQRQQRVYESWMAFRNLRFSVRRLARIVAQHGIHVTVFAGQHDKVIPLRRILPFVRQVKNCQFIQLDHGHTFLLEKVAAYYRQARRNT